MKHDARPRWARRRTSRDPDPTEDDPNPSSADGTDDDGTDEDDTDEDETDEDQLVKNPRLKRLSEEAKRHRLAAKAEKERADRLETELTEAKVRWR